VIKTGLGDVAVRSEVQKIMIPTNANRTCKAGGVRRVLPSAGWLKAYPEKEIPTQIRH